ncbi:MAG: hypothetical protein AAFY17_14830, partial [Cyanobacteria bacterium J06642_11]
MKAVESERISRSSRLPTVSPHPGLLPIPSTTVMKQPKISPVIPARLRRRAFLALSGGMVGT